MSRYAGPFLLATYYSAAFLTGYWMGLRILGLALGITLLAEGIHTILIKAWQYRKKEAAGR